MTETLTMEEVFGKPTASKGREPDTLSMEEVFGEPEQPSPPETLTMEEVFDTGPEIEPLKWHEEGPTDPAARRAYLLGREGGSGVVHDEERAGEREWKTRYMALTGKNPDYEGVTKDQAELEINLVRPNMPSALAAAGQSAVDVLASVPKSIAIAIEAGDTRTLGVLDKIDAGEEVSPLAMPMVHSALVFRYKQADPEERLKIRRELGDPRRPEENFLYQFGERMQKATQEAIPTDPEAEDTFGHKFMRSVGSTAGFAAAGLVGRIVGGPGALAAGGSAAALGAAAQATSQFEDAVNEGADLGTAFEASRLGAVVGLSEGVPIARLLDRYDKATGGSIRRIIKEGLKGGTEEAAQELFQSVMDWAIASNLYDPDRQLLKPAAESTGVGFTVGTVFSTLAAMLGVKTRLGQREDRNGDAPADGGGPEPQEVGQEAAPGAAAEEETGIAASQAPVVTELKKGQEAVERVLAEKASVPQALRRPDLGDITIDYGEAGNESAGFRDGWGLAHIIARRNLEGADGETFVREVIPEVLAKGKLKRLLGPADGRRAILDYKGNQAILSLYRYGDRETWVLSGYGREGIGPGGKEGVNPDLSYAREPSGLRADEGAGPAESIGGASRPDKAEADPMQAGTNYAGLVGDTVGEAIPQAGGRLSAAAERLRRFGKGQPPVDGPKRREAILRKLTKAFDIPLYKGRIKMRTAAGFARRGIEEVRLRNANDIEVAAHELAHILDYRVPEVRRSWSGKSAQAKLFRTELKSVSYDVKKTHEGFAEFVRLWSTQRDKARAAAPNFYDWFENFLNRSEYGPALREAQADMHDWFGQDLATRGKSKIGDGGTMNAALDGVWERFRQSVFDDLEGFRKMEAELTGGLSVGGVYQTARLTRGKHTIVEGALRYGVPVIQADGSIRFEGKGLMDLLQPVADQLDDYLAYAVGRRAELLMRQGRERLFTKGEIESMLDVGDRKALFEGVLKDYQAFNRGILDFAEAKGIIDPAKREAWETDVYIPFYRVGKTPPGGKAKGTPGDWTGIKALTGGTENLRDVLGNMVQNAAMLIDAALTNEARQKAVEVAQGQRGAKFLVRIPKDERKQAILTSDVEAAVFEAIGVPARSVRLMRETGMLPDGRAGDVIGTLLDSFDRQGPLMEFWLHQQKPRGDRLVAVLYGGKPEFFEVMDDLALRSFMALNRPAKHWLARALAIPRRIAQGTITLTIDFMGANIARDTAMGTIFSKYGFRFALDSVKGLVSRFREDETYREAIANGVGFSSFLVDEDSARAELGRLTRQFYDKHGIDWRYVMSAPDKALLALEKFANAFEMATRLGEYARAREAGASPKEAAYAAREISTDFGMRGDSIALGFFYDTVIFLKAAMNGMDRVYRGFTKDTNRRQIALRSGILALISMGLYALNRGNPLYDDLEDWDKDIHWHFFIPTEAALNAWATGQELPPIEERYTHWRYPKIWEIGAMASIAERALEGILDSEPAETAKHMARVVAELFRLEYIPAAFAPLYELAINKNRFFDRPIESKAMEDLEPWARSGPYGSESLRRLGESMRNWPKGAQLSPAQFESLLRGYFNTWAMYGLTLTDMALFDDMPDLRVDQYPLIRRFYRQHPGGHSKHVTKLYDLIEETTKARRTLRHMDKTFRPEIADEMENRRENLLYQQMQRAAKQLRAINQDMARVLYANDVEPLHDLVRERARVTKNSRLEDRLRQSGAWYDVGRLKRELRDDLVREQHKFAKEVITDIEKQKEQEK